MQEIKETIPCEDGHNDQGIVHFCFTSWFMLNVLWWSPEFRDGKKLVWKYEKVFCFRELVLLGFFVEKKEKKKKTTGYLTPHNSWTESVRNTDKIKASCSKLLNKQRNACSFAIYSQCILPAEEGLSLLGDSLAAVWLHFRGEGFEITHSHMLTNRKSGNAIEVRCSLSPFKPTDVQSRWLKNEILTTLLFFFLTSVIQVSFQSCSGPYFRLFCSWQTLMTRLYNHGSSLWGDEWALSIDLTFSRTSLVRYRCRGGR